MYNPENAAVVSLSWTRSRSIRCSSNRLAGAIYTITKEYTSIFGIDLNSRSFKPSRRSTGCRNGAADTIRRIDRDHDLDLDSTLNDGTGARGEGSQKPRKETVQRRGHRNDRVRMQNLSLSVCLSASATSHFNIRLCVRYGGVRPVCMETKALPSWTTGVEPLVERPCLPTPRWTTRWNTLLLISLFLPSPSLRAASLSLAPAPSSPPRFRQFPLLGNGERSLIRRGCSDYAEVSPPDHCGFIDTGRAGRSDLAAVRPIDVNDRAQPVSQICELNGEAESLASRASFGQIRLARWESSTCREKCR